jgi:hypothetical protein
LLAAGAHPCAELQRAFEAGWTLDLLKTLIACKASDLRTYEERILNASPASVDLPDLSPADVARLVEIERERVNRDEEAERDRLRKLEEWRFPEIRDWTPPELEEKRRKKGEAKKAKTAEERRRAATRRKMAAARREWWRRKRMEDPDCIETMRARQSEAMRQRWRDGRAQKVA